MISLLILTVGGTALAIGAGLKALDSTIDGVETQLTRFGERVEFSTRAACDKQAAIEIREVTEDLNRAWGAALDKATAVAQEKAIKETVESLRPYLVLPQD
jgi:hypothetical protein